MLEFEEKVFTKEKLPKFQQIKFAPPKLLIFSKQYKTPHFKYTVDKRRVRIRIFLFISENLSERLILKVLERCVVVRTVDTCLCCLP